MLYAKINEMANLFTKSSFSLDALPSKENVALLSSSVSDVSEELITWCFFLFFNSGESEAEFFFLLRHGISIGIKHLKNKHDKFKQF